MAKLKNEVQTERENANTANPEEETKREETAPANTGESAEKPGTSVRKPIEDWATELRVPTWQIAALKIRKNYAAGKIITRKEFEDGIAAALNQPIRG